jgi:hypothetical protein
MRRVVVLHAVQRLALIAGAGYGRHVPDALADLDDDIYVRLAAIREAEQDDIAEAEETGSAPVRPIPLLVAIKRRRQLKAARAPIAPEIGYQSTQP